MSYPPKSITMKKRIVICADGTWSKPEKDPEVDFPTNVLKLARAIQPVGKNEVPQQVFYDWGIGSYYDPIISGATGKGLHKNIMDDYRYIVQNYAPGDDLYLFGFSRGAYTIRCLCGMINNCGILKRPDAALIQKAFDHYKNDAPEYAPKGEESVKFREQYAHESKEVKFVGVWDTVGAMGIPISFLGFLEKKDEFYDTKIGSNVRIARHALAIDEHRVDFKPTIWQLRENMDMKQVWFSGAHCDIGGSYKPDDDETSLSDIALDWMIREAEIADLSIESHVKEQIKYNPLSTVHKSRIYFYELKKKYNRSLEDVKEHVLIHESVKERWDQDKKYRPTNLKKYVDKYGWSDNLIN